MSDQATISQQQTVADTNNDWSGTLSFNQFDPAQGTLQDIILGVTADLAGSVSVESLEAAPATITIAQNGVIDVVGPNGVLLEAATPYASGSAALGPYDGITNYTGSSGTVVSLAAIDTEVGTFSGGSALGPYIGTGAALLTATASAALSVTGPANMQVDSVSRSGLGVDLQYDYTPSVTGGSGSYGSYTTFALPRYGGDVVDIVNAATSAAQILTLADATTGSTALGTITQFNPALGTLEAVVLTIGGTASVGFAAENEDSTLATLSVTQNAALNLVVAGATLTADAPFYTFVSLGAYDGTTDFAGASGTIVQNQTTLPTTVTTLTDTPDLAAFTGTGTLSAAIVSIGTAELSGPAELLARLTAQAGATASISYEYVPAGVLGDAIGWANASGGDWMDAGNWDYGELSNPPASSDDVVITLPGSYTVTLNAAESVHSIVIDSPDATLVLDANLTAADNFILDAGTIEFNGGTIYAGNITLNGGLVAGDMIALNSSGTFGLGGASIVANQVLELSAEDSTISGGPTATLVAGLFTGAPGFVAVAECFARGTRIATPRGEVRVEDLRVGDLVLLASGAPMPIVWVGRRRIDCRRHPKPHTVWPVCIARGAFGGGLPHRDLLLSPDHAVFADGVLIPAKHLVNERTIRQVPCDVIEYFHIELPRHQIVLAEGLTVESYLDIGKRDDFTPGHGVTALHPDFASRVWEAVGCAPLVLCGEELVTVRRRTEHVADDCAAERRFRQARN